MRRNSWKTAYNVDFTSLTTQNIRTGGNGTKTIDGKSWTWANDANATTAALTNGTGLQCNPVANSGSAAPASRNGPILTANINQFMPNTLNLTRHGIRLMARYQLTGQTKVAQGVRLGFEDLTAPKDQAFHLFRGWASNAPGAPGGGEDEFVMQSSKPTATTDTTLGITTFATTDDVLVVACRFPDKYEARTGQYASGIPYSFTHFVEAESYNAATPLLRLQAEPLIVLAWQDSAAAGGGGFTGTFTHFRIDYFEIWPF